VYAQIRTNIHKEYKFDPPYLVNDHLKFLIATRKTITKGKSNYFLLYIDSDEKRHYVSSLYMKDSETFLFDFDGRYYTLYLKGEKAQILPRNTNPHV
jgi:hypothetical protein